MVSERSEYRRRRSSQDPERIYFLKNIYCMFFQVKYTVKYQWRKKYSDLEYLTLVSTNSKTRECFFHSRQNCFLFIHIFLFLFFTFQKYIFLSSRDLFFSKGQRTVFIEINPFLGVEMHVQILFLKNLSCRNLSSQITKKCTDSDFNVFFEIQ